MFPENMRQPAARGNTGAQVLVLALWAGPAAGDSFTGARPPTGSTINCECAIGTIATMVCARTGEENYLSARVNGEVKSGAAWYCALLNEAPATISHSGVVTREAH
ncbi:MAG: hypothetical protein CL573_01525 [Alphaproteobacteria bacterium]|nr:hypothetical protein [Alphaproteobacteria bacterium]HCP01664.1 hypothetical protein [Rhodospirillaceae bacterium]